MPFLKKIPVVAATLAILITSPFQLSAEDRMKGPATEPTRTPRSEGPVSLPAWLGRSAVQFYSKVISPVDGPRSPSYPTGTAYSRDAIKKHGFFLGVILTADRLIHEAGIHQGTRIVKHGVSRYHDPVEHNTYWWK